MKKKLFSEPSKMFINRELGWLGFNRRVLRLAIDDQVPLLERVRFLSIVNSNLDEFFMKRVGGLKKSIAGSWDYYSPDRISAKDLLKLIRKNVLKMIKEQGYVFNHLLKPALRREGIVIKAWSSLTQREKNYLRTVFESQIAPVLTPLTVDSSHPFPYISNLSTSLGVRLQSPDGNETYFARVKIPEALDQWVEVEISSKGSRRIFVSLVEIIQENLQSLFPGMKIISVTPFRITRNIELGKDPEDAEDILEHVTKELRERKFAEVVRLEHGPVFDPETLQILMNALHLEETDIYQVPQPWDIDYSGLQRFVRLNRPDLKFEPHQGIVPPLFRTDSAQNIFSAIKKQDILLHHPYESFEDTIVKLIKLASNDPQVLTIKITLYRTEENSPIISALKEALDRGKQIVVLIELMARFDEKRNIIWAKELESVGAHVCYGIVGLKIHTKLCLIVRKEDQNVVSYAHIGTGNYNSVTAKAYTDLSLLTANPEITSEVREVFNYLTGISKKTNYQHLLVSPINLSGQIVHLIDREIQHALRGKPSFIFAKMNNFDEARVTQKLYEASQAKVPIEMVVRGFCCLRPQTPHFSKNIWVRSILGRFLEHSRLYYFRNGKKDPIQGDFFIGSADWMGRNFYARVECLVPIYDRQIKEELWRLIQLFLRQDAEYWMMRASGEYKKSELVGYEHSIQYHLIQYYKEKWADLSLDLTQEDDYLES